MTYRALERRIWNLWRSGKSLEEIAAEISERTGWSDYLALVHTVRYLHGKRGVKFTRRQLRRAFSAVRDDVPPEARREAWGFLAEVGSA